MQQVILDTEWTQLEKPRQLHCIVVRDVEKPNDYKVFEAGDITEFKKFCSGVSIWIGHNLLEFDIPALSDIGCEIPSSRVIDTLVASRLFNFRFKGGHSVENYANRFSSRDLPTDNDLGIVYPRELTKIQITDWSAYVPAIRERCITDTLIQWFIYNFLKRWIYLPAFSSALRTEHNLSEFCYELRQNGFKFDVSKAEKLKEEITTRLEALDNELRTAFPPRLVHVGDIIPRATKHGTIHAVDFRRLLSFGYKAEDIRAGETYGIHELQEFNPGSLKQIIDRLWDAGWKPTEKTKGHIEASKDSRNSDRFARYGWKLSDTNLQTLPQEAPQAAKTLVERLLLASRVSDLEEWLSLVRESNKIHGQFFHIGSWTHRMSTSNPNMQNIPVPQHKDKLSDLDILSNDINSRMRSFWIPEVEGNVLVGTDADGIQMRVFAHYVNDDRLIKALVNGNKKDGTDIHTLHWKALGPSCRGRDPAKTFIYAWLLGAGVGKVSEILECSLGAAREAIEAFISYYPGLRNLKDNQIPRDAARGYFEGLDKRLVICDNTHLMLAGYLQNGEKVIMARASNIWQTRLKREGIYYIARNFVHDEWQTETTPDLSDYVGRVQAESIAQAGVELAMNCPLAGQYKVGRNWLETH